MDASLPSTSSSYSQEASPKPPSTRSGLTLVLPSLKNLKAAKVAKKTKHVGSIPDSPAVDVEATEKKVPRPVKLKPLKEVLTKLIQQIKKKDDYAFFLEPVDPNQVPGYLDAIKRPMDLGTMTHKVNRGKYRSLEEFANDLRLVTTNAKTFNPPGTIYYTEAERIEAWALDHIAKASATVIQYETDWNIDIEEDDDAAVNIDDDDEEKPPTSIPPDDFPTNGRSPSVASQPQQSSGRRGPRGPYKKGAAPTTVSESIDSEGRLPGSKDGIGSFPPCSDWAKTMVALKLKGKRYKTKKERLRFEKEGPPYLPDGSLDYSEMEDPFSVLSALVPDPLSRPCLIPVYPPLSIPSTSQSSQIPPLQTQSVSETSTPQPDPIASTSQEHRLPTSFPSTVNLPLNYDPSPSIRHELPLVTTYSKRRHWYIIRNPTGRKTKDSPEEPETDEPPWLTGRELHPADFGSFAVLAGALSEEMKKRGVTTGVMKDGEEEKAILGLVRDSLNPEVTVDSAPASEDALVSGYLASSDVNMDEYFSSQRAAEAEDYIRDMVYGGVDGLAYVRSLAEFVSPTAHEESSTPPSSQSNSDSKLGEIALRIVDELTEGRHSLLREAAQELHHQLRAPSIGLVARSSLATQIASTLHLVPKAAVTLQALLHIRLQKIDMSALINKPEELFLSEEEWAGKGIKAKRKAMADKAETLANKRPRPEGQGDTPQAGDRLSMDVHTNTLPQSNSTLATNLSHLEMEGPEELAEVLDYVADLLVELNQQLISTGNPLKAESDGADLSAASLSNAPSYPNGTATLSSISEEDPKMRNLRLNLLALAKRAPLDTIARLPLELVPEHIRHYIPTLETPVTASPIASPGTTTPLSAPPAPLITAPSTPTSSSS